MRNKPLSVSKGNKVWDAYANYLDNIDWDFFGTFTTGYEMSLNSARRSMERFADRNKKENGGALIFWVAEPYEVKDGYHTHALIKMNDRFLFPDGDNKLCFEVLKETWQIVSKGHGNKYNRVHLERYQKGKGANYYVGKYVLKKRCDYDFSI